MSVRFLIIDGYNVMHAAGLARANYGVGELAKLRHQLLFKLTRRLTLEERKRCTVVFDAIDAPPNLPRGFRHEGLTVLFAEPGHEADELIELLIAKHSAPRKLTVVSSDHRIQTAIRRRRGTPIDSEDFLKQIESAHRKIGPPSDSTGTSINPESELDFWVEEFESVAPETLTKELLDQSEPKSNWERRVDELQKQLESPEDLQKWLDEEDQRPSKPG